jgi:hypothetical protein
MKKEILEITQHVNAVLAVVFCVVYSFLNCHLYIVVGVILGGAALFFIYLPDIITIPGVLQEERFILKWDMRKWLNAMNRLKRLKEHREDYVWEHKFWQL